MSQGIAKVRMQSHQNMIVGIYSEMEAWLKEMGRSGCSHINISGRMSIKLGSYVYVVSDMTPVAYLSILSAKVRGAVDIQYWCETRWAWGGGKYRIHVL